MQAEQSQRVLVEIKSDTLRVDPYVAFVQDDSAGAIATFSGVTRNTFQGKTVVTLEYEAYTDMAEKTLRVCLASWAHYISAKCFDACSATSQ